MDEAWFTQKRVIRWGGGAFALFVLLSILSAAGPIARDAERRANEILVLGGFDWATVERYGRGMEIQGAAPSAAAGAAAVAAVARDWAIRDAWGGFSVASPSPPPPPAPQKPEAAAGSLKLQASGPPIRDSAVCQSLLDAVSESGRIEFAFDSADLDPRNHDLLDRLGAAMLRCETVWIDISGHTDAAGDAAANLALSQRRADAVVAYLQQRGVPEIRVIAKGYGAERPIADNDDAAGRARNRRIEFRVVGIGDTE